MNNLLVGNVLADFGHVWCLIPANITDFLFKLLFKVQGFSSYVVKQTHIVLVIDLQFYEYYNNLRLLCKLEKVNARRNKTFTEG